MKATPHKEVYLNSRTLQQPRWHGWELRWFIDKMDWQYQESWHPIHPNPMETDITLTQKLIFLMEIRDWVNKTATSGKFYVPIKVRKGWLAWANKRIEYLPGITRATDGSGLIDDL